MVKSRIVSACVVAALLCAACASEPASDAQQSVARVKVTRAVSADISGSLQFPCRVKASSEVNVAFRVAGNIRRICVSEGQRVAKGQLLAEIDDTDYRVQLTATEAEYAQVSAEAERVIALYEQGATTASNYDRARYGLQQIEAKLANHRNQVAYCRIFAPEAGTVQSTMFEGGEIVAAGMPVVRIIGSGRPEVEITVPASVYTSIAGISDATATFNAYADRRFSLAMLHALPGANASGMYPIRFAVEGDELPSPGMNGWVTLTLSGDAVEGGAACLPSTALLHLSDGEYVYVVRGGVSCLTRVDVSRLTSDGTAIVSGQVADGDSIVVSGVHSIADGQAIEVIEPASASNIGGLL